MFFCLEEWNKKNSAGSFYSQSRDFDRGLDSTSVSRPQEEKDIHVLPLTVRESFFVLFVLKQQTAGDHLDPALKNRVLCASSYDSCQLGHKPVQHLEQISRAHLDHISTAYSVGREVIQY